MQKLLALILISLLSACGAKSTHAVDPIPRAKLEAQVARIEPALRFECGLPTESNQRCSGDGVSMAGRWLLDGGRDDAVWEAVKASVDATGRLWRNPERPAYNGNSASRDQLLGLVEATLATREREPLQRVLAYIQTHANRLCPGDDRCDVTPSVWLAAREATGSHATALERAQDEATLNVEASTAPATYRAYLVMRKLKIQLELGHKTSGYAHAAKILRTRFPRHILARYIDARYNGGNLSAIATSLSVCMASWQAPGTSWWGDAFEGCSKTSQGHELVALAKELLR